MLRCVTHMALLCTLLGGLSLTTSFQLTEEDKAEIVKLHNHYRSQVAPSAANMQNMSWEQNLELMATDYAANCVWDHNPSLEDLKLGENLYITTGSLNISVAMFKWYQEHKDFTYETNYCPEDKMCGHYTQMVWAETNRVGCGAHLCEGVQGLPYNKAIMLVCDYSPGGNYEGQLPYHKGEPCSQCPMNMPVCVNNICVLKQDQHKTTTEVPQPTSHAPTVTPTMTSIVGHTMTAFKPSSEGPVTGTETPIIYSQAWESPSVWQEYDRAASEAARGSAIVLAIAMLLILIHLHSLAM